MGKSEVVVLANVTNGGSKVSQLSEPFTVTVQIQGAADFLFHRWNAEAVDAKSKAAKNSAAKKNDDLESYVYRNDDGHLCVPGEYLNKEQEWAKRRIWF